MQGTAAGRWLARIPQRLSFAFSLDYLLRVLRGRIYYVFYRAPNGWLQRRARLVVSDGSNGSQLLQLIRNERLELLSTSSAQQFEVFSEQEQTLGVLPNSRSIILQQGCVQLESVPADSPIVLGRVQTTRTQLHMQSIETVRVTWFIMLCKLVFLLSCVKFFGDRASLSLLQANRHKLEFKDGRVYSIAPV